MTLHPFAETLCEHDYRGRGHGSLAVLVLTAHVFDFEHITVEFPASFTMLLKMCFRQCMIGTNWNILN